MHNWYLFSFSNKRKDFFINWTINFRFLWCFDKNTPAIWLECLLLKTYFTEINKKCRLFWKEFNVVLQKQGVMESLAVVWSSYPYPPEAVVQRCSVENVFLKILQNLQENACARVFSLIKLQAWGLQFYWKRDSGAGVFLLSLRNSKNTFLYRTPLVAASDLPFYHLYISVHVDIQYSQQTYQVSWRTEMRRKVVVIQFLMVL